VKNKKEIVIFKNSKGNIDFNIDGKKETIWATQSQIAQVFDIDRSVVTKHISNLFKDREVNEKSNVQKMHITNSDKPVNTYSLDIILAVGYRSNSAKAKSFRQWATKTLRSHVIDGYTINPNLIAKNYDAFLLAVEKVKVLLTENGAVDTKDTLELIKLFAGTWFSLDAYDKSEFSKMASLVGFASSPL
jgi:prophage antirepressor-like protein